MIRKQDALNRNVGFDFDVNRRETLRINPKLNTRAQAYHPRSGIPLYLKDEDGNEQSWSTESSNPSDDYFGIARSHTDFARQKILLELNFNKQIVSEIGTVDDIINKQRGQASLDGAPPPARNIRNLHDEAGHESSIIDDGAQLTTHKRYDLDDYVEACYFVNKDGRVYQATYTDYDELHRIARVLDTRIALHLGYDKNSNRRFARAYIVDEKEDDKFLRESWYDYTLANRPILRDCILQNNNIILAPNQGMKLAYEKGEVIQQSMLNENNVEQIKKLGYEEQNRTLKNVTTIDTKSGHVVATLDRELDAAERCFESRQYQNCVIKIALTQPEPQEYENYELPTYVLRIDSVNWDIYYYKNSEKIKLDSLFIRIDDEDPDTSLYHYLRSLKGHAA
ncbi:MAG: hypothetical protein P4M12_07720, partial [Gammaproteobacteria bacterium]|nr:hypothetical protein [Gammaproteobacteria bacterium]